MTAQEKLLTADEFADLPDDGLRHNLIEGVVVEMGRPQIPHGRLQTRTARYLDTYVDKHDLGMVVTESGFRLAENPDTVIGPDVAFLSKAKMQQGDVSGYFDGAPDLAVEIVSPNDRAGEVLDKIFRYLDSGTRLVWVIYSDKKQIYVYKSRTQISVIDSDGTLDGGDVLPGFSLLMAELFKGL